MRGWNLSVLACSTLALLTFSACDAADESAVTPVSPELAARSAACDFGRMSQDARSFFPGTGNNSISADVLDLVDLMEDACDAGDGATYTDYWFDVAAIVEQVLADGTGGDAEDGAAFLAQSVSVLGPDGATPIFDPCGDAEGCQPWEGYPTPPDFFGALDSGDGAWAVVGNGNSAVCSEFRYPCSGVTPAGGDTWGVEPDPNWESALQSRPAVLFGHPIPGPSPTGELLASTELPAYQWLLIPDFDEFAGNSQLNVGLCSASLPTIDELLVQKGTTVLNEVSIANWCSLVGGEASLVRRIARFFSPAPAPLHATAMASQGPGGRAGSFTDFYVVDAPQAAILELSSQPANGTVGQPVLGQDGQPLTLRTYTTSMQSPLENARIVLTVIGNGGLIPSGNGISGPDIVCDGFVCEGFTQADEEPIPGSLILSPTITKPGSYSMCFEAFLVPLVFNNPVCTEKFNVNP